jgi:histidine kinase
VVARLYPQYDAKEVRLTTQIAADMPLIRADCERIEQVLVNLLGNSLQYTESGGAVTISAKHEGDRVCIAIQDTGIGIAADDLEKIFQRFYRVDKSRARSKGGSGIGLTIARHLVEAHGGHLWAESPGLNQGSTFYFTLLVV